LQNPIKKSKQSIRTAELLYKTIKAKKYAKVDIHWSKKMHDYHLTRPHLLGSYVCKQKFNCPIFQ